MKPNVHGTVTCKIGFAPPLSLKKILSTDHLIHFWHLTPYSGVQQVFAPPIASSHVLIQIRTCCSRRFENLWALMKAELYRLHPELEQAPNTNETLDALIRGAQEA